MALQTEPVITEIRAEVNKKSFNDGVKFARDTGKQIDPLLRKNLQLDIAKAQLNLKKVKELIKNATNEETKLKLTINANQLQSNLTEFKRQFANLSNTGDVNLSRLQAKFNGLGSSIKNAWTQLASSLWITLWITWLVRWISKAVDLYREYGKQLKILESISWATKWELAQLDKQAKEIGATTKFTSTQVSLLQTELAKLWFTAKEILNSTGAITNLAIATGEDVANSAQLVWSVIRQYQLDASEAWNITDILTGAFNRSALWLSDFSDAIKYVWPVAKASGLSFKDTSALLWVLADNGIKWSMAGTSLRKILVDLWSSGKPFAEALADLSKKWITLSSSMDEVGRTAQTSLLILWQNLPKIKELWTELGNVWWSAERLAQEQMKTLDWSLTALWSSVEWLWVFIGEKLAPTIAYVADLLSRFTTWLQSSDTTLWLFSSWVSVAAVGVGVLAVALWVALWPIWWVILGITALTAWAVALSAIFGDKAIPTIEQLWAQSDKLTSQLADLERQLESGMITIEEYTKKTKELKAQQIELEKKIGKTWRAVLDAKAANEQYNKAKLDTTKSVDALERLRQKALQTQKTLIASLEILQGQQKAIAKLQNPLGDIWFNPQRITSDFISGGIDKQIKDARNKLKQLEGENTSVIVDIRNRVASQTKTSVWASGWWWGWKSAKDPEADAAKKREENLKKEKELLLDLSDAYKKQAQSVYADTIKNIDKTKEKIDELDKKIADVNKNIADLGTDKNESIAARVVEIQQALKETNLESEKRIALEKELSLATQNTTAEDIAKQTTIAGESPTERILRENSEKKAQLETQLADLTASKVKEQATLDSFLLQKTNQEKAYTDVYKEQIGERESAELSSIERIRKALRELRAERAAALGWSTTLSPGGWWSNNSTFNQTFNISDPTSAESIGRILSNQIQ